MAATRTYVDTQGERRWAPHAVCPAHEMPCRDAIRKRRCRGSLYGDDTAIDSVGCRIFWCEDCGKAMPAAFGAYDDDPDLCDDCWVQKHEVTS